MNFVRTISGAIATSLVTTAWQDKSYIARDKLAGLVDPSGQAAVLAAAPDASGQVVREVVNNITTGQSLLLATNDLMVVIGVVFLISSVAITLAPKPSRIVDAAAVGH